MAKTPKSVTVSTLHEYIAIVNQQADSDVLPPALFRGQSQDFPLLPKLARLYNDGLLKQEFLLAEQAMYTEFARQAVMYSDGIDSKWDWLALAQHYGMATRLLDWTENPLLALWFAVKTEPCEGKDGVVWLFAPTLDDYVDITKVKSPFEITKTRVLVPPHANPRIRVQTGRFTVHHYQVKKDRFVPLERNVAYKGRLTKISIEGKSFAQIRCDLDRCGVNSGSMFPDLAGLASHIEWQHSKLRDE